MSDFSWSDKIATAALVTSTLSVTVSVWAALASERQARIARRREKADQESEEPLADLAINAITPWPDWYEVNLRLQNRSPYILNVASVELVLPRLAALAADDTRNFYFLPSEPPEEPQKRRLDISTILPAGKITICRFYLFCKNKGTEKTIIRTIFENANRRKRGYTVDSESLV